MNRKEFKAYGSEQRALKGAVIFLGGGRLCLISRDNSRQGRTLKCTLLAQIT